MKLVTPHDWSGKVNSEWRRTGKIPAVVLSAGYTGLAVIRSLGRHGVPVFVCDPDFRAVGMHSRYATSTVIRRTGGTAEWGAILAEAVPKLDCSPVVLAVADEPLEMLQNRREELEQSYRFQIPSRDTFDAIFDKRRQYRMLIEMGYCLPRTRFPCSENEAVDGATELGFPCLAKPGIGVRWKAVHVDKLLLIRNSNEAAAAWRTMDSYGGGVVLQEHIPGDDDQLFTVMSYIGAESAPLAAVTKRKLRQYPEHFGNGSVFTTVLVPELENISHEILGRLRYTGFACIEYKLDPRDRQYKLIEINPRPISGYQIAAESACDLTWIAYQELTGNPVVAPAGFRTGTVHVNLPYELRRVWQSRSPMEALKSLTFIARARSFAVLSWEDPGPAMSLVKRAVLPSWRNPTTHTL